MAYIAELPEEIDYKTFKETIFVYKLEHDQECYLFDIYMDEMLRVMDENKEMREHMSEKFQEIFGPVPTYTATTDELGNIVSVTPNKPNLTLVK